MKLKKAIAEFPLMVVLLGTAVDLHYAFLPSGTIAFTFHTAAAMSLIGMFIGSIFLGQYASGDSGVINASYTSSAIRHKNSMIKASIALVLLAIFFGIGFLGMLLEGRSGVIAVSVSGAIIAICVLVFRYYMLQKFEVPKVYEGIRLRELGTYLVWYHWLLIVMIVLFALALFPVN